VTPSHVADLVEQAGRCRQMWATVLEVLLSDARRDDEDGQAARAWLRQPDPLALALAGLDVEVAGPRLRAMAADPSLLPPPGGRRNKSLGARSERRAPAANPYKPRAL
jgi:hypothetical protein